MTEGPSAGFGDTDRPATRPRYFAVAAPKFVVMSACSLGIYELYWFYRNWRAEREHTGESLSPLLRTFFAPVFAYSLFRRIRGSAGEKGVASEWSAGLLALAFFVLLATWRLPDPWWLLSLVSFLPLLPVLETVRRLNAVVAPAAPPNASYSGVNVLVIILGGLLLVGGVIGTFLPEEEPAEIIIEASTGEA